MDAATLFRSIGELIGSPPETDAAFGDALATVLRTLVSFDHIVVFGYRGDARPINLYDTFTPAEYVVFVAKYQIGPYLLDPFYRATQKQKHGFRRMRDLTPDRFYSSEYFRSYYVETGLAEEVGFFVPVADDAAVVCSLMRKEATGVFPARSIALLTAAEPVVSALIRTRFRDLPRRFDREARGGRGSRRSSASPGSVWRDLNLTEREAVVVELVLQGHSSDSIARHLEIRTGTVKVHRRNVYRKLNITSQTQLLSIYLTRIGGGG